MDYRNTLDKHYLVIVFLSGLENKDMIFHISDSLYRGIPLTEFTEISRAIQTSKLIAIVHTIFRMPGIIKRHTIWLAAFEIIMEVLFQR